MKLAYLVPERNYEFFLELIAPLESAGIHVSVNEVTSPDIVLAGMLPATPEWLPSIRRMAHKTVLWHWDLYSFVNLSEPRWANFLDLLPAADDIWSCSYETARQLKERLGVDSVVIPAWVNANALRQAKPRDYVFYAATSRSLGKRVDWAVEACGLLQVPLVMPATRLSRERYIATLAECRVYLMPAFEESNGSIPAMEAAACGKPVVCADIPSNREVFGDTAYYFKPWDFEDCKEQLRKAWALGENVNMQDRILANYELQVVAKRIVERLYYVQSRPR